MGGGEREEKREYNKNKKDLQTDLKENYGHREVKQRDWGIIPPSLHYGVGRCTPPS